MTEQQEIAALRMLAKTQSEYAVEFKQIAAERVATLEATNAAQAERIAELGVALQRWLGIAQHCSITEGVCCCGDNMAGHSDPMQCGHMATDHGEYVTSMLIEETNALLQSSSPPEPQATVELTDDEIVRLFASYWEKTQTHPCNISPDNAVIEFARALLTKYTPKKEQ